MIINVSDIFKYKNLNCGKKIVLSHGCFDIFHIGHLNYLKESKKLGDVLFVSITNDEFINKGDNRPRFNINQRLSIINELKCVDYCVISNDFTCLGIIKKLMPDIYSKGVDVKGNESILGSNLYKEYQELLNTNGKLIFVNSNIDVTSTKLYEFI